MMRMSLLLLVLSLAGCKLIDQTTFATRVEPPSQAQVASLPPPRERVPLLVIRYTTPNPDYADSLRAGVGIAEQRRPGTAYDVVAVVPARADPAQLAQELGLGRRDAASVMRAMVGLGVADTRIDLGASTQAGLPVREVRVYLR